MNEKLDGLFVAIKELQERSHAIPYSAESQ